MLQYTSSRIRLLSGVSRKWSEDQKCISLSQRIAMFALDHDHALNPLQAIDPIKMVPSLDGQGETPASGSSRGIELTDLSSATIADEDEFESRSGLVVRCLRRLCHAEKGG